MPKKSYVIPYTFIPSPRLFGTLGYCLNLRTLFGLFNQTFLYDQTPKVNIFVQKFTFYNDPPKHLVRCSYEAKQSFEILWYFQRWNKTFESQIHRENLKNLKFGWKVKEKCWETTWFSKRKDFYKFTQPLYRDHIFCLVRYLWQMLP